RDRAGLRRVGSSPAAGPAETPPTTPVAAARGAEPTTSRSVTLAALLSDPSLRADRKSAFRSLFARWGVELDGSTTSLGCERGRPQGLRCLSRTGTCAKLRRIDLPAIIELSTTRWDRRYA